MEQVKPHLDFIDLAKGLCILMVVSYHVDQCRFFYQNEMISDYFAAFRIPFYYFLSGLFLSLSKGVKPFVWKKIERLLVPFIFFYLITVCYGASYEYLYSRFINPSSTKDLYDLSIGNLLVSENANFDFPNIPIWFLVSLFTTYMMFVVTNWITRGHLWATILLSLAMGAAGYYLGYYHINLPLYLDTSLTCMPFVMAGMVLRKECNILTPQKRYISILLAVACFIIVGLTFSGTCTFYKNDYHCSILALYTAGLAGSCGMFWIAKTIDRLPIINYVGRYSLIVLGMHSICIGIFAIPLNKFLHLTAAWHSTLLFCLTVAGSMACIWFMKRYLPWFVAQKSLPTSFHRNRESAQ